MAKSTNEKFKIGDPIEIRFGTPEGETWRPATVDYADPGQVVAVFNDGTRYSVGLNQNPKRVRAAKPGV